MEQNHHLRVKKPSNAQIQPDPALLPAFGIVTFDILADVLQHPSITASQDKARDGRLSLLCVAAGRHATASKFHVPLECIQQLLRSSTTVVSWHKGPLGCNDFNASPDL